MFTHLLKLKMFPPKSIVKDKLWNIMLKGPLVHTDVGMKLQNLQEEPETAFCGQVFVILKLMIESGTLVFLIR